MCVQVWQQSSRSDSACEPEAAMERGRRYAAADAEREQVTHPAPTDMIASLTFRS